MTILMKIRGLQKSFGEQTILKNIDFDISNQERIGLVGCNGAGKTTLANILSGHAEADKGTVQTDRTLKIGYLLQSIEYSVHDFNSILTGDEGGIISVDEQSWLIKGSKLEFRTAQPFERRRKTEACTGTRLEDDA